MNSPELLTFCKRVLSFLSSNRDGLDRRVADAFGRDAWNFGHGEVNEPALVGVQRPDVLLDAGSLRFLGQELRHLAQLVVFAAPEVHAVDEQALVAQLLAERAVDDVLERLQSLAPAREQRLCAVSRRD